MPSAWLLDLTRLVSRVGREAMTGIDRVELAYLAHFLAQPQPFYALLRSRLGFVLLNRDGAQALLHRLTGVVPWGPPDLWGRFARHAPPAARAAADLRRLALARAPRPSLGRMLRRHLPAGTVYLNVGHANLTMRCMAGLRRVPGLRIGVLVHDTIPLDHPGFSRPDRVAAFRRKMQAVARHADLVIHSTADARQHTEQQLARLGRVPPGVVAPLGVTLAAPAALPDGLRLPDTYFVALGTIEPRKNHALLLDIWDQLPGHISSVPGLLILGARGWRNEAVLARLDRLAPGASVQELPGLSDGVVVTILSQARALLFPTLAEGFGLPPVEAAALGGACYHL